MSLAIKLQDSGERAGWSPASWQMDSALASVRDPAELAKLPAAERRAVAALSGGIAEQVAADPLGQGRAHAARREWSQAADGYARGFEAPPDGRGPFLV